MSETNDDSTDDDSIDSTKQLAEEKLADYNGENTATADVPAHELPYVSDEELNRLMKFIHEQASNHICSTPDAEGSIDVAGVIYRDSDGYMRFDPATKHGNAQEVVAALLASNPELLLFVLDWFRTFMDSHDGSSWEAMYGH